MSIMSVHRVPLVGLSLSGLTLSVSLAMSGCDLGGGGNDDGNGSGDDDDVAAVGAEPLDVVDQAWRYTLVPEARCGNGGDVGVATNRGTSDRLVIYLEGGGACWDSFTCDGGFATYVKTGLPQSIVSQITSLSLGIFDRREIDSPFVSDSFAYVPYCTGDAHGGRRPETPWGVAHVGADNLDAMLPRILATFPNARQVVLAGTSAGGYGVGMTLARLRASLPDDVSVTALIDSAIPLPPFAGGEPVVAAQNAAWALDLCEGCTTALDRWDFLVEAFPEVRFGLIQSLGDMTLRQFFSPTGARLPRDRFATAVRAFFDSYEARDNVSIFEVDTDQHVFVYDADLGARVVSGVSLGAFMKGVVGDAPAVSARATP
jgi:hypothetical protein